MQGGRDLWWHEAVARQADECEPEQMDSEDMLYLLYTSGSTGKPKGDTAHDRRLSARRVVHGTSTSSICTTTTPTGAPPTSAG